MTPATPGVATVGVITLAAGATIGVATGRVLKYGL